MDINQNQPKAPQHRAGGRLPWRIDVRATLAGAHCSPLRTYKRKTCPVRLCGTERRRGLRTKLDKRTLPTNILQPVRCVVDSRRWLTTVASCGASSVCLAVQEWQSGMSPPISQRWDEGCGDVASISNIKMICVLLPVLHRCHKLSAPLRTSPPVETTKYWKYWTSWPPKNVCGGDLCEASGWLCFDFCHKFVFCLFS